MRDWDDIPHGTRVLLAQPRAEPATAGAFSEVPVGGFLLVSDSVPARDLLGNAAVSATTTYLFPSGSVRTGAELQRQPEGARLLQRLPPKTRILVGFVNGGRVTSERSLTRIAGSRWNYPSTYYRVPGGSIRTGSEIEGGRVPRGTLVFFRQ